VEQPQRALARLRERLGE
jgi:nitrite reductase/ring-hydroxylating ferredoxin subunit